MSNADFDGIILDADNYEGEINHIGIPHERSRHPDEALTEEAHAVSRSTLGKLIRGARIEIAEAIYDASAAAQTSPVRKCSMFRMGGGVLENGEKGDLQKERKNDFEHIHGVSEFGRGGKRMYTK